MHIVEVVSLSRKMPFETLLYTSRDNHTIGDLVQVPFQESTISALVVTIYDLASVRSHIRTLPYRIKEGIESVERQWVPTPLCTKLVAFAKQNSIPLNDFFQLLWDGDSPIFDQTMTGSNTNVHGAQGSLSERASQYRGLANYLIVCPNKVHSAALTVLLPNSLSITTEPQLQKYRARTNNSGGTIIPNALFSKILPLIPMDTTIIFDGVLSPQFQRRAHTGEFFHHAQLFINLSIWLGHPTIIGDELLPFGDFETLWRNTPNYTVPAPIIPSPAAQVKHKKKQTLEDFQLAELVKKAQQGKKILVFCNQRDLYGYVSCPKCHYIERCEACNNIVRLAMDGSKHVLECIHCKTQSRARDICRSCGGITLETRRQGIEGYSKKFIELSPDLPVYTISTETKHIPKVVETWNQQGGILITTSKIFELTNLHAHITYIAPHTWTNAPETPEAHYYEYLWLYHRSDNTLSLPITREILTGSPEIDVIDLSSKASVEYEMASRFGVNLPCTLL